MAGTILAVAESRQGEFNSASLETVAAGQQLAEATGGRLVVVIPGQGLAAHMAAVECQDAEAFFCGRRGCLRDSGSTI